MGAYGHVHHTDMHGCLHASALRAKSLEQQNIDALKQRLARARTAFEVRCSRGPAASEPKPLKPSHPLPEPPTTPRGQQAIPALPVAKKNKPHFAAASVHALHACGLHPFHETSCVAHPATAKPPGLHFAGGRARVYAAQVFFTLACLVAGGAVAYTDSHRKAAFLHLFHIPLSLWLITAALIFPTIHIARWAMDALVTLLEAVAVHSGLTNVHYVLIGMSDALRYVPRPPLDLPVAAPRPDPYPQTAIKAAALRMRTLRVAATITAPGG